MAFEDYVDNTQMIALPELYEFQIGNEYQRYTSFHKEITFEAHTFAPASIKRSNIQWTTDLKHAECTITAPVTDLFQSYIANQPIEPVTVRIVRAVYGVEDANYSTLFKGRIKTVAVKDLVATAKCRSGNSVLEARIPGVTYQSYCNHEMFDGGCGLNSAIWKVDATVDGISNSDYTFSEISGYTNGYFTGGYIKYSNDMRMITLHDSTTLSVHVPFDSRVAIGTAVEIFPSCRQDPSVCDTVFNNIEQYLGMPYIPNKNPVFWGI